MPETAGDAAAPSAALNAHRGTRAIQRMVEFAPSTGGLALWVRHQDLPDADAPLASTDGNTVFYGAKFARLPLPEQVGLIAHEVLHIALRHAQRYLELRRLLGDVDLQLFNLCADAIVNSTLDHLTWLALPKAAIRLDRLLDGVLALNQRVEKSLLEWDVERLYRTVDDRQPAAQPQASRQRQQGEREQADARAGARASADANQASEAGAERRDGPRAACARAMAEGGEIDLVPAPGQEEAPELAAEQAREWGERLLRAHASDGAHSMLRALIADLPRTRTPWQQVLRTQLARSLSPRAGVSWSRPSRSYIANQGRSGPHRRMPWEPGFSATRSVPRLVVIVDVSGSIEPDLMQRFSREIEAITRRLEAGLVLVIGDDQVRRVERCVPGCSGLDKIEFDGGGGTDFTPLLEEADRHRPDIGVVLTDLEGPARFRPRWPVIWAVPEAHAGAVQPFGRKLVLD